MRRLQKIALGAIAFCSFAEVHAGAYMYCVSRYINNVPEERLPAPCHQAGPCTEEITVAPLNASDPPVAPPTCRAAIHVGNGWDWTPWEKFAQYLVTDKAGEPSRGDVWLYGELADYSLTYGYQNLRINSIDGLPYYDPDPPTFCQKLVKLCTDKYGPDFRYVGAGDGAVAGWAGVSLSKIGDPYTQPLFTCPNWRPGAFIQTSSFESSSGDYDVTCRDTTVHYGPEHFWSEGQIWTNGVMSYGFSGNRVDQKTLDNSIGLFYCTGQPSE